MLESSSSQDDKSPFLADAPQSTLTHSQPPSSKTFTGGGRSSFSTAKYDAARNSATFDRRRTERSLEAELQKTSSRDGNTTAGLLDDELMARPKYRRSVSEEERTLLDKLTERALLDRVKQPWRLSFSTFSVTCISAVVLYLIVYSFFNLSIDPKGCNEVFMAPSYHKISGFSSEHTRFATKYSLYLYREHGVLESQEIDGIPVLFITGNAGSYKQARSLAAEAARYWAYGIASDPEVNNTNARTFDFFTADFNEDFTAFHGQTLLDQAEYLNDAVAYILAMYHDPQRPRRDVGQPDPSSVILIGHSMGGVVARTMLTMPNYLSNSVNTIITESAPHARAPIAFDSQIVSTYHHVNDYWRKAHSQKWANDNPLWHVTLISIASGGLDTVVPSDYSSVSSIVPETHGFTVFTTGIPNMWTSCDHVAITWCDQLRKAIVKSLYEIANVQRPSQTQPREERMRIFRKWFLTGLEQNEHRNHGTLDSSSILTLEDDANQILSAGERLVLRGLGDSTGPSIYLMPILNEQTHTKTFNLLTDQHFSTLSSANELEVLICSVQPSRAGQRASLLSTHLTNIGWVAGSTRLNCRSTVGDMVKLPASRPDSHFPFDHSQPLTFLSYTPPDLVDYDFVAIIDKSRQPRPGWLLAEFQDVSSINSRSDIGLWDLLTSGLSVTLPPSRPLVTHLNVPALKSSLLAFNFKVDRQPCSQEPLLAPLLRQYLNEPYESRFTVNVQTANITLHGVSPFLPPALVKDNIEQGVSLQLWTDPTCNNEVSVRIEFDLRASLGKLVMRYRLVIPAIPVLVTALVLRKQFMTHDATGIFIPFNDALSKCIWSSLPLVITSMTLWSLTVADGHDVLDQFVKTYIPPSFSDHFPDFSKNDLLLGSQDGFFWFLMPVFGFLSVGLCVAANYISLLLVFILYRIQAGCLALIRWSRQGSSMSAPRIATFAAPSPRRRLLMAAILLFLVATTIPYQFAYVVACIVQLATCVRALNLAKATTMTEDYNFYNYAHSILILMLIVLPINIPVLVVWVHNLAVHWLTPFSSHHNILSIAPFIVLVETMTGGKMLPRITGSLRVVTHLLFFVLAVYAAIYGVSYTYRLHHIANLICTWLVLIYCWSSEEVRVRVVRGFRVLSGDEVVKEEVRKVKGSEKTKRVRDEGEQQTRFKKEP